MLTLELVTDREKRRKRGEMHMIVLNFSAADTPIEVAKGHTKQYHLHPCDADPLFVFFFFLFLARVDDARHGMDRMSRVHCHRVSTVDGTCSS